MSVTVPVRVVRGVSNTKYHRFGKPNYWVAWVTGRNGGLNFIDVPRVRADGTLDVEVEVPDEASRVVVGAKGCGRVAEFAVDDYRDPPDDDPPAREPAVPPPADSTAPVVVVENPHPAGELGGERAAAAGRYAAEPPADDGTYSLGEYEDTDPDRTNPPAVEPPAPVVPAEPPADPPGPEPVVDDAVIANVRPHMMIYDIPDRAEIPNPSGELYGRAVRINLSCWVVAEGDIPWGLLHRLNNGGATAYVVPFDPRGARALVTMMTDALRKEIADALRRCERSARLVEDRIRAAGESTLTPDEADEWTRKRAADVAERMGDLLSNLETAAARFGIPAAALRGGEALRAANDIGSAMNARAAVYAEAVRAARAAAVDRAVVDAAATDNLPPGVLADALNEAGEAGAADALRAAFDPGNN